MSKKSKNIEYDIIKEVLNGDIDKFEKIIYMYEDKLFHYIKSKTKLPQEEIESLLQDLFIKVYKNINSYNPKYNFKSWIYKIAYNLIIDNYKDNKKKEIVRDTIWLDNNIENSEKITYSDILEDTNSNIEENFKKKELRDKIEELLDELDDKYKDVIILKYLEWLSYNEISDILKLSIDSLKKISVRGLKKLQKIAHQKKLKYFIE